MIKHKFYLRKDVKGKNGYCLVFLDIAYNGNRLRLPANEVKVLEKHWSPGEQRVKRPQKNEAYNFCDEFNLKLGELDKRIDDINRSILLNNHRISKEYILDRLRNRERLKIDKKEFFPVFAEYFQMTRSIKAPNTLKGITSCFNFLLAYEKEKKCSLNFEDLNQKWFERFRRYAFEEKKIGDNYFKKIIASLKAFLNWCTDNGHNTNLAYKKFKASSRETEVIYLTMEELMTLYKFDFPSKRLSHVRDFYCFGCFTGLRFSDIISLRGDHIKQNYIVKPIQKTQEIQSRIPLSNFAKSILEKYKESIHAPLPKVSAQKFNSYIKECCRQVGINSIVTTIRYSGSSRVETTYEKWQLITSHTARKTFVTNSLILGMKEMVIRNITGHKKDETFRRYVKISDDIKRNEVVNTWDRI